MSAFATGSPHTVNDLAVSQRRLLPPPLQRAVRPASRGRPPVAGTPIGAAACLWVERSALQMPVARLGTGGLLAADRSSRVVAVIA